MRLRPASEQRPALSLLEVLVAVAVLLFAMIAIGRLISFGADRALDVQGQARATELCQSKLDQVLAGDISLSSQSDVPFDEDPDWHWSLTAEAGAVDGLWSVTVQVTRKRPDGFRDEVVLNRMLIDPSRRGNLGSSASSSSSSTSSSGSSASGSAASATSSSGSGQSGASAMPAAATAPAASGAARGTGTTGSGAARGSTPAPATGGR
jgi:general secretion pathway protein I